MLDAPAEALETRAERIRAGIGGAAEVIGTVARVGGGALPLLELEGPAVAIVAREDPSRVAEKLRAGDPPVLGRIHDGRLLLDPRTLSDGEAELVIAAVRLALAGE